MVEGGEKAVVNNKHRSVVEAGVKVGQKPKVWWDKEIFPTQETWTDRYGRGAVLMSPHRFCLEQISPSS